MEAGGAGKTGRMNEFSKLLAETNGSRWDFQRRLNEIKPAEPPFAKKYAAEESSRQLQICNLCNGSIFLKSTDPHAHSQTQLMASYLNLMKANPPYGLAGSIVNAGFFRPGIDSVFARAEIANPDSHQIDVFGIFRSFDQAVSDTFPMFDDGKNDDGIPGNAIFGGGNIAGTPETNYQFHALTISRDLGTRQLLQNQGLFTTIGPVSIDRIEFASGDTIVNPGDRLQVNLLLKNAGLITAASAVSARLLSTDSCATVSAIRPFGDIPPGELAVSSSPYEISFNSTCTHGETANFVVDIASDVNVFWQDSLTILINPLVGISSTPSIPLTFALDQNFPNPFNPSTTIRFSIAESGHTSLIVYNLIGQEVARLIDQPLPANHYEIPFNAENLASGVYLYKLRSGDFQAVKKMLIMQ